MKEMERDIIEGGGVLWRRKKERSKGEREGEDDQEGIRDCQERKRTFAQRGHCNKREEEVFGKKRFFEDRSSRLLGLVFCLMFD